MSEKIAYARKRWGATIFYLDSNVFGEGFDTKLPPGSNVPWVMPTKMLQQLTAQHPDCLVIPEWSDLLGHIGEPAVPKLPEILCCIPW